MQGSALPQRVIMGIMGFLAIVVSFLMRGSLSVAITEMVIPINSTRSSNDSIICTIDIQSLESDSVVRMVSTCSK